ncbi:hypothetical protein BUALT_Bualt14G0078800 [Buddleja alternifolia]|uniref:DDE Tnp4 domain-containing protein n=1 Tax=Buddleja alternifolia TaxID=168488 RepID=A0AAV6WH47_9LAMI|nr:hypothetical protein BUALT_Bualt14G0078800 [Buddleja alternifolia]
MHQSKFMLSLFVEHMLENPGERRRECEKVIRYVMAHKIPKQIEHLENLVELNDVDCLDNLRMPRGPFTKLCYLVKNVGGLTDSKYVTVKEKVALFLFILAHHKKMRIVLYDFKRSMQTVSKYFHEVLAAFLKLHTMFLVTPIPIGDDCTNLRWKFFKGCLGALDGTYIKVKVNESDKGRYRTRNGDIAVNVMVVCDINQNFIYLLTGWEGSAADCRVLRDAINRPHGLKVPHGNYYLCDNGYANGDGFLTPYKGVWYHLDEWGLLKQRWAVLHSQTFYSIQTQNRIIMACALLHNFIRLEMQVDPLEDELDNLDSDNEKDNGVEYIDDVQSTPAWTNYREELATKMFYEWSGLG